MSADSVEQVRRLGFAAHCTHFEGYAPGNGEQYDVRRSDDSDRDVAGSFPGRAS